MTLEAPHPLERCTRENELLAFNGDHFIIVWNYAIDTWIQWNSVADHDEVCVLDSQQAMTHSNDGLDQGFQRAYISH